MFSRARLFVVLGLISGAFCVDLWTKIPEIFQRVVVEDNWLWSIGLILAVLVVTADHLFELLRRWGRCTGWAA